MISASQRWVKLLRCLLCLPVQCSQSICGGEVVQQWGPLSETVFPAAHHLKGSRTWKQRVRGGSLYCGIRDWVLKRWGTSPMFVTPHWSLCLCRTVAAMVQPSISPQRQLSSSAEVSYSHENELSKKSNIPLEVRELHGGFHFTPLNPF